jgi:polyferredoxin
VAARRLAQGGFLLLTLAGVFLIGGNAERWCPFGGVEALFTFAGEGNMLCSLAVSNFFILGGVLLSALILRRAFCGYACPIGTLSEWIRLGGARLGLRGLRPGKTLDTALSALKYGLLAVLLVLTWRAGELVFRGFDPCYALVGRHGEDITFWAYVVSGGIVLGSLFVSLPFCRWLCPFAAVLNPFSRWGAGNVVRDAAACKACGKCSQACPMGIEVESAERVTEARCTACLECVECCPTRDAGALHFRLPGSGGRSLRQPAVVALLLVALGAAVLAAQVAPIPSFRWARGEPTASAAELQLRVRGLTCRGRASLFVYFLDRDDDLALDGALGLDAWPGPGTARARITFDPTVTDADTIREAITEPYFDRHGSTWRMSPFAIER